MKYLAFAFLFASAAHAADPPAVLKIRSAYQAATKKIASDGGIVASVTLADQSSKPTHKITFVSNDAAQLESNDETLQLVRVEETWSNLGTSTAEFLYDAKGALIFHYVDQQMGSEGATQVRMWIDGVVVRVQEGTKVNDAPTDKHKASAERAKAEAKRLLAFYKELRATKVGLP